MVILSQILNDGCWQNSLNSKNLRRIESLLIYFDENLMIVPDSRIFHTKPQASSAAGLWRREGAFSLMELLVVLTVLGLLAALAAPGLLTIKSTSLSAAGVEFSGFLNLCRSKAIAERTSVRLAIVTRSPNPDDAYRKYAGWKWDKRSESYVQYSEWRFLPVDAEFEKEMPDYIAKSSYADSEKSVVEGDYVLDEGLDNQSEEVAGDGETLQIQYLTFSPSGRAYVEGAEKRNLILVIRESGEHDKQYVNNWFHFTVDTLTGRARIYRP